MNRERKMRISSIIPYTWYDVMEDLILRTKKDGYERAFSVCKKGNNISITDHCVGDKCSVMVPSCPTDSEMIGNFHTHPKGSTEFSTQDIFNAFNDRLRFKCLGTISYSKDYTVNLILPSIYTKCIAFDTEHPKYEEYRNKIISDFKEYEKINNEIADMLSAGKEPPEKLFIELDKLYDKLEQLYKDAKKEGVIGEYLQGIRESVGEVSKIIIEDATEMKD